MKISLPQFLGAVIGYQLKPLHFTLLHVSLKRLVLGLWCLVIIGAMASNLLTAVKSKITHLVEQTYCRSGDIEAQETVTFHDCFKQTYPPGSTSRDELVQKFKNSEWRVAQLTGWIPPTSNAVVLPWPQDGKVQRLLVEPNQLGLFPDDSVKGPSKMVCILDTMQSFLDRPFLTEKEPQDILFAKDQSPGEQVRPWSLVHSIGMGRSSAARIILECVVRVDLPDAELVAAEGIVTALLRMRATYDPATTAEAQLQRTLRTKTQMAERSRPDPLMMANRWSMVLGAEGLHFASVMDERINAFNSNQADAVTISAPERAFIKLWRHQTPEFLQLLEYHWQNFKVAESAVPLKIWAMPDLSPDTKVVRADRSKPLWQSIMKWSPEKNYYWLLRCIGTFVKNIKEQQVSGQEDLIKGFSQQVPCQLQRCKSSRPSLCLRTFLARVESPSFKPAVAGHLGPLLQGLPAEGAGGEGKDPGCRVENN